MRRGIRTYPRPKRKERYFPGPNLRQAPRSGHPAQRKKMILMGNRAREGYLDRKALSGQPVLKRAVIDADLPRPLRHREGLSLIGKQAIISFVATLLKRCCPPAVPWIVSS